MHYQETYFLKITVALVTMKTDQSNGWLWKAWSKADTQWRVMWWVLRGAWAPRENLNYFFSPSTPWPRPHGHYAGGICKRCFYSKKASNIFRPHYAGGILNATIMGHFRFVFAKNPDRKITCLSWHYRCKKAPSSKCFMSTLKLEAGVSKFLPYKNVFGKI